MRIEEPDKPIVFPVGTALSALVQQQFQTIGDFYRSVRASLRAEWFNGDPARQVKEDVNPVFTLTDAEAVIDLIVEQGEGTTTSPLAGPELAHYYRFAEIFHQRTLVPDTSVPEGYSYSGQPIPFDATGVLPIVESQKSELYPPGTAQRVASDTFNQTYSSLLRALHITFNGQPDNLKTAKNVMGDLTQKANQLMQIPIGNGTNAAPCYEVVP